MAGERTLVRIYVDANDALGSAVLRDNVAMRDAYRVLGALDVTRHMVCKQYEQAIEDMGDDEVDGTRRLLDK